MLWKFVLSLGEFWIKAWFKRFTYVPEGMLDSACVKRSGSYALKQTVELRLFSPLLH